MPESVKALGQGLVDCRRFADTLAPSELVDERYSGWIFDVQRHHNLALSARSWDFGQVDERCGNTVAMIDS